MILRSLAALAVASVVAACASVGAGGASGAAAQATLLYVTNQGAASVSVIDVDRREEVERVDLQRLGFGPDARPHDVAVEPDGSFWYVSLIGENRVLKLDRANRLVGQVETSVPGLAVVVPGTDLLLVGRSMTAVNPPASVAVIRRSDMALVDEIGVVFPRPHAMGIGPDGGFAYSASLSENRMAVLDPAAGTAALFDLPGPAPHAVHTDPAHGHAPHTLVEFAISPDGRTMVGGGEISGELIVFDLADPARPRPVRTVALGGSPWHPVFTPDGRWVFVPLHRANRVAVVDATTWQVAAQIEGRGLAQPHQATVSPDGRVVFVSNNNTGGEYVPAGGDPRAGTVVVIDVITRAIVGVIEVGANATGMDTVPARRGG